MAVPAIIDEAPIALMLDLGSGRILHARETDRRFIPASLTKLMTVYTAFEMIADGQIRLDQQISVREETFLDWRRRGSSMFLSQGDLITVDTLLKGIVTVSANDGSIVLAEGIAGSVDGFTALMNAKARELGMEDSHFHTPNGWPDEGRTYTTARDLGILASAMITEHPDLYAYYYAIPQFTWNGITQKNRNPVLGSVAGADGLKTGFTNEAGYGFVGSAQRGGRRVVMVIAGAQSSRQRKAMARAFLEWGFDAWDSRMLFENGRAIAVAQVQGGRSRHVEMVSRLPVSMTFPNGQSAAMPDVAVRYYGPIEAPVRKGRPVGELLVTPEGGSARAIPLFAGEDVDVGGPIHRLRDGLIGLFT